MTQTQLSNVPKTHLTIETALRQAVCRSTDKGQRAVLSYAARLLTEDGQPWQWASLTGRLRVLRWALFVETVQREGEAQS